MPVRATSSPKIALIKVDLPTPVLPKIARLNRPRAASCLSYSARNESRNQSGLLAMGPSVGAQVRSTLRSTERLSSFFVQDPNLAGDTVIWRCVLELVRELARWTWAEEDLMAEREQLVWPVGQEALPEGGGFES